MFLGPMTLIVAAVLVICFIAGVAILAGGRDPSAEPRLCPHCQYKNPRRARYCAGCGQKLSGGKPDATV